MTVFRVVCVSLASRAITSLLGALFDSLIADYDTSSRLITLGCVGSEFGQGRVSFPAKSVWDSVFFVHLAVCGYQYEQFYAFYPLYPGLLNVGRRAVQAIWLPLSDTTAVGITGLFFNIAVFAISAVCLNRLSQQILASKRHANLATLLYCCNPASVFYSAPYTESIYACASFAGLLLLYRHAWVSTLLWCAAAATRSNGVLYCCFILYKTASEVIAPMLTTQMVSQWAVCLKAVIQCMVICLPTVKLQLNGWHVFCNSSLQPRSWCSSAVPNIYSFVQSHYWGVGLFKYYTLQQIPNFLLAAPMLILSIMACYTLSCQSWQCLLPSRKASALQPPNTEHDQLDRFAADSHLKALRSRRKSDTALCEAETPDAVAISKQHDFVSNIAAPYVIHLEFLTATAVAVMNIQVVTRFLSACPAVYWYAASLHSRQSHSLTWAYFLGYIVLGTLLHPNFYPWT